MSFYNNGRANKNHRQLECPNEKIRDTIIALIHWHRTISAALIRNAESKPGKLYSHNYQLRHIDSLIISFTTHIFNMVHFITRLF